MSLLFAERPLVINTQLAMKIGLNEAIVLQQLHYWLRDTNSGMECDGVRWIYNTTEQWLEQFPFWSESTLKRAFASLKTLGLLRCVHWADRFLDLHGISPRIGFDFCGNRPCGSRLLLYGRPFAEKSGITGDGAAGRLL